MSIEVDWDRYAEQYDNITIGGANPAYLELAAKVKHIFAEIEIKKDSLVVDLGGGTGNFSLPVAEMYPGSRFIIVDLSPIMLQKAEEKAARMGLSNVEVIHGDVEDIGSITRKYSRPISHVIMIHCLYATRSLTDPDKPQKILRNIFNGLEDIESRLVISDINRPLNTNSWIPYCLWHAFKKTGSIKKTYQLFKENDQAKLANRYIDAKQKEGSYLLCNLDEFLDMLRKAGFTKFIGKSDKYYRGKDNFVVAAK